MNGRRDRRKDRTRRALLDAALDLFGARGIYDTRIEDITEAADLGKGAFYNYFETKSALVAELLGEALDELVEGCSTAAAPAVGTDDRVRRLVEAHQAFFARHPAYPLLVHQARGLLQVDPASAPRLRAVFTAYLSRLGRLLAGPGDDPPWNDADLLDLAAVFAATVAGYGSFALAAGSAPRPETPTDVLVTGLVARLARAAKA